MHKPSRFTFTSAEQVPFLFAASDPGRDPFATFQDRHARDRDIRHAARALTWQAARKPFPVRTVIRVVALASLALAMGATVLLGQGRAGEKADPARYALVGLSLSGDAYVLDHSLSAEDCQSEKDSRGLWKVSAALRGIVTYKCEQHRR